VVCHVYDRWNILQRMNSTNLARGPWTENTIQNNAATIEVFLVYDRWNILQRTLFCMVCSVHGPRVRLALFRLCKIFQRS
jgi:hypothetical protein